MHSNRKLSLLALILALCLILSSCALVKKDAAVDAATEIVKVAGKVFTKGEVQEQVDAQLQYLQSYYQSYYGYNIDITDKSIIADVQQDIIGHLVEDAVVEQKATELGVMPLSEEAQAEVDETWQEDYDLIRSIFFSDVEIGEEEGQTTQEDLDAQIETYVAYYLGATRESLAEAKAEELLKAEVTKDVAVTDEEIQADFDEKVETAKAAYLSDLSAYGTAVMNGSSTIYYRPAGYRMVKQILIRFLDEDQSRMDQLQDLLDAQNTVISSLRTTLTGEGVTDTEEIENLLSQVNVTVGEMDFTVATLTDLATEVSDTLSDEVADDVKETIRSLKTAEELAAKYESLLADVTEQAYARIGERADEVLAKLAEGADWNELVAEYNDDPGMAAGAANAETGYPVCENMSGMDAAFTAAAMALEKVGDVSPKTRGMYGYYIVKYESEVPEGAVDLSDVRADIEAALLTEKQDAYYEETVTQWVNEANAVIDLNALNN